jgi:hypothetical protein
MTTQPATSVHFIIAASLDATTVEMPRGDALAVLGALGLEPSDFGVVDARELAPRCRRALWPSAHTSESVRERVRQLLFLAERAGSGLVLYS